MAARQMAAPLERPAAVQAVMFAAAGLAVASALELLILRTFTRTAIHIPGITALREPYEVLSLGGRYAYFVSVAMLLIAVSAVAIVLWWGRDPVHRGMAMALGVFGLLSGMAALDAANRFALDAATSGAVAVIAIGGAALARDQRAGLPIVLFAVAFLLSASHTLAQTMAQEGLATFDTGGALNAAEYAGVAFAFSAPLLARGAMDRTATLAGVAVSAVTFAAFLGNGGATARFLLLWNEGLSGAMPSIAYAIAAGCLASTCVALLRARNGLAAAGLVLLLTGGIGLHSTYQSGLALMGMSLLALVLARPAEAAAVSESAHAGPSRAAALTP